MLARWADHFLNETGYFAELRRWEKNPENSESRVRNLKDFMATMDRPAGGGRHWPNGWKIFSRKSRSTATARRRRKTPATP